MRLLLALLFVLLDTGIASGIPNYTEHWFVQPVDHFNILSNDTFKQRYLVTGKQILKFKVLFKHLLNCVHVYCAVQVCYKL